MFYLKYWILFDDAKYQHTLVLNLGNICNPTVGRILS